MDAFNPVFLSISIATASLIAAWIWRARRLTLPPGPHGLPIIGNIFDLPKNGDPLPWITHRKLYGSISSVTVLGRTVVLLNDLETTDELLNKRSAIYSGRPIFPFAGEMVGWDQQMIMAQNGSHFRAMRRLLKSYIGSPAALVNFHHIQELETRLLLTRVLEEPEKTVAHIRLAAGAIALKISHGYTIETKQPDPLVELVERAARQFYLATMPGAWLVDVIPILRYLPIWFPGGGFKKKAALYRKNNMEQTDRPHNFVKQRMESGLAMPSFTSNTLSTMPDAQTEHALKFAATAIYGGGSDPSVAILSTFVLLMCRYPDIQKTAQNELDAIVGSQRLPLFTDRKRLPYVDALIKEILRWHTVGRIGIPHRAVEDDSYKGYFIPKNSIIIPHMWNITHDPSIYAEPSEFRPSRFLSTKGSKPELDPTTYIFGFGRRACPGNEFATENLFIVISMMLSVFRISKMKDEHGVEIEPICEFEGGTTCHPKPFAFSISPRSAEAKALIQTVYDEKDYGKSSDGLYI